MSFVISSNLLLMEELLHQLIGSLSHYLQGFIYPRWCRISGINSMTNINAISTSCTGRLIFNNSTSSKDFKGRPYICKPQNRKRRFNMWPRVICGKKQPQNSKNSLFRFLSEKDHEYMIWFDHLNPIQTSCKTTVINVRNVKTYDEHKVIHS